MRAGRALGNSETLLHHHDQSKQQITNRFGVIVHAKGRVEEIIQTIVN